MFIIICKFIKNVDLLFDKTIYDVVDWTILILLWLLIIDWDLFRVIIFDKNFKFVSNFWQTIFRTLNIKIFTITIYHFQTNEQFERTNQTIKIVLRYLIVDDSNVNWVKIVSSFQFDFNNASNVFIDQTLNQLKFDFLFRDFIISLTKSTINLSKLNFLRFIYREKTFDVMSFVNAQMKFRYDNRHKSLMLKVDDMIYLRFHKNYSLLNKFIKKLNNQYVESFLVKRRINRLIYELNCFLRHAYIRLFRLFNWNRSTHRSIRINAWNLTTQSLSILSNKTRKRIFVTKSKKL